MFTHGNDDNVISTIYSTPIFDRNNYGFLYPVVIHNIAMENGPFIISHDVTMTYLLRMVILCDFVWFDIHGCHGCTHEKWWILGYFPAHKPSHLAEEMEGLSTLSAWASARLVAWCSTEAPVLKQQDTTEMEDNLETIRAWIGLSWIMNCDSHLVCLNMCCTVYPNDKFTTRMMSNQALKHPIFGQTHMNCIMK